MNNPISLTSIDIISYKSFLNEKVVFTHAFTSIVGLNEAGKSSLLECVRALDQSYSLGPNTNSKLTTSPSRIKYNLKVEDDETFQSRLREAIDTNCESLKGFVTIENIKLNSFSLLRWGNNGKRYSALRELEFDNFETNLAGKKCLNSSGISSELYEEIKVSIPDLLNKLDIVDEDKIDSKYIDKFRDTKNEDVNKFLAHHLETFLVDEFPRVVYWRYSKKYLIPSKISYSEFSENNDPIEICEPLFNIFLLCDPLKITDANDLNSKIEIWKSDDGEAERQKDSTLIGTYVNRYIKSIWPEFKEEVHVKLEKSQINILINDPKSDHVNFYSMSERSQGAQTFLSFLLTVAADTHSGIYGNFVLILDEPETHLHPSGVKFMRDELKKISEEGNLVVIATHSVFMIDRENIERHLIVKKDIEKSTITKVDTSTITQEAVLYEALGTRIDDFSIPQYNLLFEGNFDLSLFDFYCTHCLKKENNPFLDYRMHDGGGTKRITSFFESSWIPNQTKWILLLDKDAPGRDLKRYVTDNFPDNFAVHFYSIENDFELEDILPIDISISALNTAFDAIETDIPKWWSGFTTGKAIGKQIEGIKSRLKLGKENNRVFEQQFKSEVESLVNMKLKEVISSKNSTYQKRLESFKSFFPEYTNLAQYIVAKHTQNMP